MHSATPAPAPPGGWCSGGHPCAQRAPPDDGTTHHGTAVRRTCPRVRAPQPRARGQAAVKAAQRWQGEEQATAEKRQRTEGLDTVTARVLTRYCNAVVRNKSHGSSYLVYVCCRLAGWRHVWLFVCGWVATRRAGQGCGVQRLLLAYAVWQRWLLPSPMGGMGRTNAGAVLVLRTTTRLERMGRLAKSRYIADLTDNGRLLQLGIYRVDRLHGVNQGYVPYLEQTVLAWVASRAQSRLGPALHGMSVQMSRTKHSETCKAQWMPARPGVTVASMLTKGASERHNTEQLCHSSRNSAPPPCPTRALQLLYTHAPRSTSRHNARPREEYAVHYASLSPVLQQFIGSGQAEAFRCRGPSTPTPPPPTVVATRLPPSRAPLPSLMHMSSLSSPTHLHARPVPVCTHHRPLQSHAYDMLPVLLPATPHVSCAYPQASPAIALLSCS